MTFLLDLWGQIRLGYVQEVRHKMLRSFKSHIWVHNEPYLTVNEQELTKLEPLE